MARPTPLSWQVSQVFGEEGNADGVADEDIISAMAFDPSGNYIALGDKAGRLIIFDKGDLQQGICEYTYATELQSHTKEFDYLR